ncbi:hypothetical protein FXO38_07701 [Capsicum annuum]|nr:hypothetical protein FXO38_07701 [Capsicum annuum]
MSWPEVATHDRNPNSQSISTPTSPTNGGHASSISSTQTIACTPIFEVGSTSRRSEATEKYSNESTASNIGERDLHCNVVNAAIWTHNARVAAVVHVVDDVTDCAIEDPKRLATIKKLLRNVLYGNNDLNTA